MLRAVLALALTSATLCEATYSTKWGVYDITSWDGTKLTADADVPYSTNTTEKFPLIIFINSWGIPGFEYIIKTIQLAKRGYVALEYQARGFYLSGGVIGTAGPDDIKDVSAVIDWALKKWPQIDPERIGMAGISYGGGLALLGASHDTRVKAVAAMSSWANLPNALWWQHAPSLVWADLLEVLAKYTGRQPPILKQKLHDLFTHNNMTGLVQWGDVRSPDQYLEALNSRKVPIFLSNNLEDNLFHSALQLDFWMKLAGPKRLSLMQGTHGEAEVMGLLGVPNKVWNEAVDWFDHFFYNAQNGVERPPLVRYQVGNKGPLSLLEFESFETWPPATLSTLTFHATPRGEGRFGGLSPTPQPSSLRDTLSFSKYNEMSSGIPVVSAVLKPVKATTASFLKLNPKSEVAFVSEKMERTTRTCGTIRLEGLRVIPSTPHFQLYAYAYSYDSSIISLEHAVLISHSPVGVWEGVPGEAFRIPSMEFRAACVDIPAGHHVAIGLNLHNSLYSPYSTNFSVELDFTSPPVVRIPVVPQ